MIRVQRTRAEVSRGPLRRRHLDLAGRAFRRTYYDRWPVAGGGSGSGPRPFGEIDLRNAPEIAFFRRRGRIPLRAIRAPRARASRRAPFWGLRCVRCGGRSQCGPSRRPPGLSPSLPRTPSALAQHPSALHTIGAAGVSAPGN